MKEIVKKYIDNPHCDFNCAEKIIHAANEKYNLKLSEKALMMMAPFGGGMKIQSVCGLASAALAVIGIFFTHQSEKKSPILKQVQLDFLEEFEIRFGSVECRNLRDKHYNEELKACDQLTIDIAKLLEDTIVKYTS
jgi:C_GCAxxG_C_C family probable redox protein